MQGPQRPILLTGSHGQLGGDLLPLLAARGSVVAPSRAELNLADPEATRSLLARVRPTCIINPAAYTSVDKAESEPQAAFALNEQAVHTLGAEAARLRIPVWHFSTDYVFNGEGNLPWREDDPTHPLNVYGASKLAGEKALASSGAAHLIFRTSWLYGTRGKNFLLTILQAAREREELRLVADQTGAPTWSRGLAHLTLATLEFCEATAHREGTSLADAVRSVQGVYHACDAGTTTWFGFAQHFLGLAQAKHPEQRWAKCTPISSDGYPTAAKRPRNSRLNCEKVYRTFGMRMPNWKESTAKVMQELNPTP